MSKEDEIVDWREKSIVYEGYNFKFYYDGGVYINIGLSKAIIFDCINFYDYAKGEPTKVTYKEFNKLCEEWINESAMDYIENYIVYM